MSIADLAALLEAEFPWPEPVHGDGGESAYGAMYSKVARARTQRGKSLGFSAWDSFRASSLEKMPWLSDD